MNMAQLKIALPKGRLLDPSMEILESLGYDLREVHDTRKLVIEDHAAKFLIAKPMDVSTYVEYGAADVGVVGQDALRESECDVYEPLLLPYGNCRLVVAGNEKFQSAEWKMLTGLRVATKYPKCAMKYFASRGLAVEIIHVYGSVELAPVVGLADLIVDVVDTGRTLKENGLIELDEVFKSQAILIVNRASNTLRVKAIRELIEGIANRIEPKIQRAAG
jgi:ATP phosphoribosyltransferase